MSASAQPATIASVLWDAERRFPRRPAVLVAGRSHSFEELAAQSRRLIGPLEELGASRGEPVALFLENSLGYIVAHYALSGIGALVVPLNPHFRGKQLEDALELCEATCVVSSSTLEEALVALPSHVPGIGRRMLLDGAADLDQPLTVRLAAPNSAARSSAAGLLGDLPLQELPPGANPDDDAMLFLTSGTTGTPKGIRVTHRQALFGIDAWVRGWSYGPETVSLPVAPFFHVAYNPLVIGAHRVGGAVAIVNSLQARAATREVELSRVTAIMGTPFFYMQLLNDRTSLARDLSSIETVIYCAAPTPVPVIRALQQRFPKARLLNSYGLTETCTAVACLEPEDLAGREASVGRALPGVLVSIRGEDSRELPSGEVGEVCCRGPNVITSYYKSPGANATRFHDGWLRTGDMGYLDRDSFLYLVGRCDDLINVAGEKTYPCDIENVLYDHHAVLDAAVTVVPDPAKGQLVKAFVVPRSEEQLDLRDLKRFCMRHLPPAFVPKLFEVVKSLPRNPSGKILRRKLVQANPQEVGPL